MVDKTTGLTEDFIRTSSSTAHHSVERLARPQGFPQVPRGRPSGRKVSSWGPGSVPYREKLSSKGLIYRLERARTTDVYGLGTPNRGILPLYTEWQGVLAPSWVSAESQNPQELHEQTGSPLERIQPECPVNASRLTPRETRIQSLNSSRFGFNFREQCSSRRRTASSIPPDSRLDFTEVLGDECGEFSVTLAYFARLLFIVGDVQECSIRPDLGSEFAVGMGRAETTLESQRSRTVRRCDAARYRDDLNSKSFDPGCRVHPVTTGGRRKSSTSITSDRTGSSEPSLSQIDSFHERRPGPEYISPRSFILHWYKSRIRQGTENRILDSEDLLPAEAFGYTRKGLVRSLWQCETAAVRPSWTPPNLAQDFVFSNDRLLNVFPWGGLAGQALFSVQRVDFIVLTLSRAFQDRKLDFWPPLCTTRRPSVLLAGAASPHNGWNAYLNLVAFGFQTASGTLTGTSFRLTAYDRLGILAAVTSGYSPLRPRCGLLTAARRIEIAPQSSRCVYTLDREDIDASRRCTTTNDPIDSSPRLSDSRHQDHLCSILAMKLSGEPPLRCPALKFGVFLFEGVGVKSRRRGRYDSQNYVD
ncbi:hypothetical protein CPB85DRAFT_1455631 [Mucidula mucida]|nr:hypothetical protein CPB85DRAFT_1455631 [Mucidula mucida]